MQQNVVWSRAKGNRIVEVCSQVPLYIEMIVRFYEDGKKISSEVFLHEPDRDRQIKRWLEGAK